MGPYLCTSILFTNMKAAQQCLNFRHCHWLSIRKGSPAGGASIPLGQYRARVRGAGKILAFLHRLGEEAAVGRGAIRPCSLTKTVFSPFLTCLVTLQGGDLVAEEASCCSREEEASFLEEYLSPRRHTRPWFSWGTRTWGLFSAKHPPPCLNALCVRKSQKLSWPLFEI